ncbi:hypothetical protein BMW23_0581 [Bodo saltans virus]|uniref:Uncharacterized protein n=1 Tax=Bodo saltans virus TaxID=2024608 RepID=A0A2H4UUN9_9VIRU|nr:hypothetical protein QJ851_gp0565 [Bodo saltans virus]ATZ80628.1 hypothetical protein BMW23_0581 [Bodo saltans virus]
MLNLKAIYIYAKKDIAETYKKIITNPKFELLICCVSIIMIIILGIFALFLCANIFVNLLDILNINQNDMKSCKKKGWKPCDFMTSKIPIKCLLILFDIFIFVHLITNINKNDVKIKAVFLYVILNSLLSIYLNVDKITLYLHTIVICVNCLIMLLYYVPKQIKNVKNDIDCIKEELVEIIVEEEHKKEDNIVIENDNMVKK